ncbi:HAMP domain-containing histidine kinase [Sphingomonas aliaeris]|uniref:histidine kinase n=2 Tax=Sphingomonas aliaeris TaxID=2759526 RepID=A0A974NXP1_9SPHN|nr:HAMP domain-containing histidine kinase [Sphingomonas aliaeris]
MSSPFGAQSTWRQLVDLIGRRRTPATPDAIARLQSIRSDVPALVRAASARALAEADPPAALVRLFCDEDISIAAPVLRAARLETEEWIALLPGMSSAARSVLRHRRDLPADVVRALEVFGPQDFRLPAMIETGAETPLILTDSLPAVEAVPVTPPETEAASDTAFVSVGAIARNLPVFAEALRQADTVEPEQPAQPVEETGDGPFQIADLVARIDAYKRNRDDHAPHAANEDRSDPNDALSSQSLAFRFETDPQGIVRWIEGATRAALIGTSLDFATHPGDSRVDGVAAGAFRRRTGFSDARLLVEGRSDAAGEWRISGVPVFEPASGRFTGYRGTARRPRMDESATPSRADRKPAAESLRHLVHELRTPTNAIAGFAEMIETQLLGPVPQGYRDQAATIRRQTADLLTAIEDIDMAARLESDALDLRADSVPVGDLLRQVASDLAPLATLRGTRLTIDCEPHDLAIAGDERAVERLVGRVMATLVASGGSGETIGIAARLIADTHAILTFDRPKTLAAFGNEALMSIDAEVVAEVEGAPLLGTGFALRLARNLAIELGGTLSIDAQRLTLRLPAAVITHVEQASSS